MDDNRSVYRINQQADRGGRSAVQIGGQSAGQSAGPRAQTEGYVR
jgi:hypothetical protein